jgi:serine/threonine protein kinase
MLDVNSHETVWASDDIPAPKSFRGFASNREYSDVKQLCDQGSSGLVYTARETTGGGEYVIKVPRVPKSNTRAPIPEKTRLLTDAMYSLIIEFINAKRLAHLDCVAEIEDFGLQPIKLSDDVSIPAIFIVQRYVKGKPLSTFMETHCKPGAQCPFAQNMPTCSFASIRESVSSIAENSSFSGIPDATCYLRLAKMLLENLKNIHGAQIVHGDIRPENIMIESGDGYPRPVFIDFGQAIFRDLEKGLDIFEKDSHPGVRVRAPEGDKSVASDMFMIGVVLYFLATGSMPSFLDRKDIAYRKELQEDNDALKNLVVEKTARLYEQNSGIADLIARCLRNVKYNRVPNTEVALQDLDLFFPEKEQPASATRIPAAFDGINILLFKHMADARIRLLLSDLMDMKKGTYDLRGDHEGLVDGLARFLSRLGPGDEYLTVSLPSFWSARNLGINGRFLAMNRFVARQGAAVRRIMMLTEEELDREDVLDIVDAHQKAMRGTPKFQTKYWILEARKRETSVRGGYHFGLLITSADSCRTVVFPIYGDDGIIVQLRLRSNPDLAPELMDKFEQWWSDPEIKRTTERVSEILSSR